MKKLSKYFFKKYGAFASPTASLHFDNLLLKKYKKNIDVIEITLACRSRNFLPLRENKIEMNKLHKEKGYIS